MEKINCLPPSHRDSYDPEDREMQASISELPAPRAVNIHWRQKGEVCPSGRRDAGGL